VCSYVRAIRAQPASGGGIAKHRFPALGPIRTDWATCGGGSQAADAQIGLATAIPAAQAGRTQSRVQATAIGGLDAYVQCIAVVGVSYLGLRTSDYDVHDRSSLGAKTRSGRA
jgi:hypothetical protein